MCGCGGGPVPSAHGGYIDPVAPAGATVYVVTAPDGREIARTTHQWEATTAQAVSGGTLREEPPDNPTG